MDSTQKKPSTVGKDIGERITFKGEIYEVSLNKGGRRYWVKVTGDNPVRLVPTSTSSNTSSIYKQSSSETVQIKIVPTSPMSTEKFRYKVIKKGKQTSNIKDFNQPTEGQWFNLGTGRVISKLDKKKIFIISDDVNYPRVAGTQEQINDFFRLNRSVKRVKSAEGIKPELGPLVRLGRFHKLTEKHKKLQRVTDFLGITSKEVREGIITNFSDPSKLTPSQVNQLGIFTLSGLNTKFIVSNIADGDTFNVVFFLPMNLLGEDFEFKKGIIRRGIGTSVKGGYFNKQKCRLYGWDSAEHDTFEGLCSAVILLNEIRRRKGVIYGKIGAVINEKTGRRVDTFGKFGRILIDSYLDPNYKTKLFSIYENYKGNLSELETYINKARILPMYKKLFIDELQKYRSTKKVFVLGEEYYGDTKSETMKTTHVISTDLIKIFYDVFKVDDIQT